MERRKGAAMSTTHDVVRSFWDSYNQHDLDKSWERT
jgi:hypothetical protein